MNFEIPDMTMEVIEALHLAYKDNLDLEIDCLTFLGG